jgi:diaminopimelate decarboxylase
MSNAVLDSGIVSCLSELIREKRVPVPVCAFIYDLNALRKHAKGMVRDIPQGCSLFYAIKANPDRRILECLAPVVDGFEAASIGEIRMIREVSADIPILFGGPGKKDDELEEAMERGVMLIHAESLHELRRIAWIAERREQTVSVLLRINLRKEVPRATVTMAGRATQFGMDEAQVPEAIQLLQTLPHVQLEGFHMHSVSNNLDAVLHARLVATYLQRVKGWIDEFGLSIAFVNAGGGFGISYAEPYRHFEWETFMDELRGVLSANRISSVRLLFEPGRYMVAGCGYYAAEVIDLKTNHGKHYAIIRGGTHHFRLPASWKHNHPFEIVPAEAWDYPFPRPELRQREISIAGELCTPKDILAGDVPVERLRIGDVLLFTIAGAYGWTISHHDFLSHPHPQMLYIDDEYEGEREAE